MEHQILDNKASKDYRHTITHDWKATYQLVPPDVHHANAAERAIQTFKAHFLRILAGIDTSFPNYLWDKLLLQTELTQPTTPIHHCPCHLSLGVLQRPAQL